jgi:hypothetical protein
MGVAQDLHGKHPIRSSTGTFTCRTALACRTAMTGDVTNHRVVLPRQAAPTRECPCEQQLSAQRLLRRIKFGAPGHHQGTPMDVSAQDGLGGQDCKGRGEQPGTDVEPLTNALPL